MNVFHCAPLGFVFAVPYKLQSLVLSVKKKIYPNQLEREF